MKHIAILSALSMSVVTLSSFADETQPVNLDRLSLMYNSYDDTYGDSASGKQLTASTSFGKGKNWVFHVSAASMDYDDYDLNASTRQAGIGYAVYDDRVVSILSAGIGRADASSCYRGYCASVDENYTFTRLDFIFPTTDKLELTAGFMLQNMTVDSDSETTPSYSFGADYFITESLALSAAYNNDDDSNSSTSIGLTYSF